MHRRSQIVEAAIDTLAVEGLAGTSFAKIARTAGLSSTGLISYHFAGKRELMDEVARVVTEELTDFVDRRMREAEGATAQLRAFIVANVEFAAKHHARLRAARAVGGRPIDTAGGLVELLRAGQLYGELRFFDTDVMATAIRAALDRVANDPDIDPARYSDELATIFELATRGA